MMQWLTLTTALLAAALTVPLLVLLYFLKLKRAEQVVSSTLLWQRAIQDLQVNAPFQKIRRNILLFLQLLALAAVLVALAGPVLFMDQAGGQRYVLLIDRSASMNAADEDSGQSRLDMALVQSHVLVESLRNKALFGLMNRADQAMVIAFDDHAKVMCNFTSDKARLLAALEAVTPSDRTSLLSEAMTVARAFTENGATETQGDETQVRLHLFSDGRIADLGTLDLEEDELVYHKMGQSSENIAITAMQARRSYDQPDQIQVFASLANYGESAAACDVQVSVNSDVVAVRHVTLPPAKAEANGAGLEPGQQSVDVTVTYTGAGLVEVRQLQPDPLSSDDVAWAVIEPPRKLNAVLVTRGNPVLLSALQACPLNGLKVVTPEVYAGLVANIGVSPYDVTIMDNCMIQTLPRGHYLVFSKAPPVMGMEQSGVLENQVVIDWQDHHPVLRHVDLTDVIAPEAMKVTVPRDAQVLAEFNEGPAMILQTQDAGTFLWVGFDCLNSNWPFDPGFVLFCYNALDFLGMQQTASDADQLGPGDPIVVSGLGAEREVELIAPNRDPVTLKTDDQGSVRFPGTEQVGVYQVAVDDQTQRTFAVNLLDAQESDVQPRSELVLAGGTIQAQTAAVARTNQPLWPYAVLFALVMVVAEWWVYNAKMRV